MPDFSPLLNSTGATWKCGHARRSPLAKLSWSRLMQAVQERRLTRATVGHELAERAQICLGCQYSRKHSRKCIAGHVALALLQLALIVLFATGVAR